MYEDWHLLILLAAAGICAGAQNAVAGGGSFITLPALVLAGLDPKLANIASTVALFPGQVLSAVSARPQDGHSESLRGFTIVSFMGGGLGATLLLFTPVAVFDWLVPWLVLLATALFAWGAVKKEAPGLTRNLHPRLALALQFPIAVYGGYFGGGVGFLMLALLGFSGSRLRGAGVIKNRLVAIVNTSAVLIFIATTALPLECVAAVGVGALVGTVYGVWLLKRITEEALTKIIICLGLIVSLGLFIRTV
ncbi:MAG TPA: sulfite exporter TauE/SafE family protein [Allosphingosinicella sp.]|nr:sulfite exporter TauE/SafE family protein [Allosphingosinicella sp.]